MTRDELAKALPQALIDAGLAHPMNADKYAYGVMRALYPRRRDRSREEVQRLADYGKATMGRHFTQLPGRVDLPRLRLPTRSAVTWRAFIEAIR